MNVSTKSRILPITRSATVLRYQGLINLTRRVVFFVILHGVISGKTTQRTKHPAHRIRCIVEYGSQPHTTYKNAGDYSKNISLFV